jgi:hypothetical protein
MANQDSISYQESLSKQMESITAQQKVILGQVNAGNNNIQLQLQKMNADMILLDQRITNLENVIKPNQHMAGKKRNRINNWEKERQPKGKLLNTNLIYATTNERLWLVGDESKSYHVGEKINNHTISYIDDVKNKVYIN